VVIVVAGAAWFMWRPAPRSERALQDLAGALFERRKPTLVGIYIGSERLPVDLAAKILHGLSLKYFTSSTILELSVKRAGSSHSSLSVKYKVPDGKIKYLALNSLDAPGGGAIQLRRLMESIWDGEAIRELGRFPSDLRLRYSFYERGLDRDRRILEEAGLKTFSNRFGQKVNLDEALEEYRSLAESEPG
jgi:hypothetical protein